MVESSQTKVSIPITNHYKNLGFHVLLVLVVIFAAGVRLHRLGEYPQRFNADEMNAGYEAWSLWSTGADQHGTVLPLHIRGFNEYNAGLSIYIMAPFVGMFGLSEFSTRLPFALMGILTVYLTGILGQRWFGPSAGLIAALLLAIDPWHVNFTRLALTVGVVPLFIVLALLSFTRFIAVLQAKRTTQQGETLAQRWAILAGLCFALLTYSYPPIKLEAPLLLIGCMFAAWEPLRQNRRITLIWLGSYVLFLGPLIYDQLTHWQLIQGHFGQVSVFQLPDWHIAILRNYAAQFNPSSFFFDGLNRTLDYKLLFGVGELFWLEGPLWIAAFIGLLRRTWQFNLPLLLGIWYITYPIASSLTWGPTAHREINLLPLPELMAGYGAVVLAQYFARSRVGRVALVSSTVTALGVFGFFCLIFFVSLFPTPILETSAPAEKVPYNIGLKPALDYVIQRLQSCDHFWIEPTYQAYMAYLFFTRYPPQRFQQANVEIQTDAEGWQYIPRLDNVEFRLSGIMPPPSECNGKPAAFWVLSKSGTILGPGWKEVFTINNSVGAAIWRVQVNFQNDTLAPD